MPDIEELNETVEEQVDDATVITVPIDDSLTHSNEAADAAAVGAALALKADKSQISGITVNGQGPDLTGAIQIDATDVPMDSSGTSGSVGAAIGELQDRTAEEIPMSDDPQAQTVADAIAGIGDRAADAIPMSDSEGAPTVAQAINSIAARTAGDIPMSGSDSTSIFTAMAGKLGAGDIDAQLQQTGKAADAKAAGDAIAAVAEAAGAAVRSVNEILPDDDGDVTLTEVPYSRNLISDNVQTAEAEFIARTSGGHASIDDGDAWLMRISGRRTHTGIVEEVIDLTVTPAERPEPEEGDPDPGTISAEINKAAFRSYADESGTFVFTYGSGGWNVDPTAYGITVTGTPISGDVITVVYVKADRGLITQSTPDRFISTGWNLYDHTEGYAKVLRYSDVYGFHISGSYSQIQYSATEDGPRSSIAVVGGGFTVPGNGFVHVTGGSATDTAIWMDWTDWGSGYSGDFQAHWQDEISLASVMAEYFQAGLCQVGTVYDVIDLNTMSCTRRIERLAYSEQTIAALDAAGRAWEADEDYIYAVLADEYIETHAISVDGAYTVSDHGYEVVDGTTVAPYVETLYGNNLKNKLERDVVTISQQALEAGQQRQVRANISAARAVVVDMGTVTSLPLTMTATGVTEKMVCVKADLGTPSAQTGDWTVTTAADSVTISGTVASSGTTVKLTLVERDEITATTPAN